MESFDIYYVKNSVSGNFSQKNKPVGPNKGAFTNYEYKICLFLTTYPPPLVNVVFQRPLRQRLLST